MTKVAFSCSFALSLFATCALAQTNTMTSGRPSAVLPPDKCQEVWAKAVPSGEFLLEKDAAPYIVNFKQADGKDNDGTISKEEFQAACAKGLVKSTGH
jgi:hypothetical protein